MDTNPNHHHPIDDRVALDRFVSTGDPIAFEMLTTRYQTMVLGTCVRILRSPADAEDAAQETFLKLAQHASKIRSNLGAWLHAAAMGSSIDLVRRASVISKTERAAAREDAAGGAKPTAAMLWSEVEPVLDQALSELEPSDRELLVARFLCTRAQRDIAQELGVSEGTVSRRLDKALERLRAELVRRGVGVSSVGALFCVLGAIPAVVVPATLASRVVKIPLLQNATAVAGSGTNSGASLAVKAIGVGVAVVLLGGGGRLLIQSSRATTPQPGAQALIRQPAAEAPDRPRGEIGPFQIVSAGERNGFARGLWIRDKRLAIRHGIEPESGLIKIASLEITAREQDDEGVVLLTRVREIIPAGDMFSRFKLGQAVDIRASFDEHGRLVLEPLTEGIQLGANEPNWYGVRPPMGWEEYGRIPDEPGPDRLRGPWAEAERIPVTITNREIRFGTDVWQSAVYRIVRWEKREGYARVESIHAGGRDPRLIGTRFRLIIRQNDNGYTIAYFPPNKSAQASWPSGFEFSPGNPVTVVKIKGLP